MRNHHLHNLKGEQKDQLLVTTDKKGKKTGVATREDCHKGNGKIHLAFMAFVFDENNLLVLTKRSKNKSLFAGFWDASVISHVLPGETVEEASKRRAKEELGTNIDFQKINSFYYFAKFNNDCENEYCYILIGKTNEKVFPNQVEIEEIKKVNFGKLLKDIKIHPNIYTPWLKIAIKKSDLTNYTQDVRG